MHPRELRIAVFSRQARELRVIGIVLKLLKNANHHFTVVATDSPHEIDIAMVDADDALMAERLAATLAQRPSLPVIHLVSFLGQSGARHELLTSHLMSTLLPMLQRVSEGLSGRHSARGPAGAGSRRLNALVVDDSPTVRTQLNNAVLRMGMDCDTADCASAALARLHAKSYDIIYVDVVMPDMDGYKLTREIKRDRHHKATPVIILTSQSSPFDRARGALAGCDLYLTKPVSLNGFYEASVKALRKSLDMADLGGLVRDPSPPPAPPKPVARPVVAGRWTPEPQTPLLSGNPGQYAGT